MTVAHLVLPVSTFELINSSGRPDVLWQAVPSIANANGRKEQPEQEPLISLTMFFILINFR
jgi:hypothetical protein